ncbi:hypothetical protein KVF89_11770 [Nocardioides carbamazepini]|uniref:hypothetical protein n=1 Tax=Nocardioides carbamazepini TaxID=2854259 RepID=UPI00214A3122|nr:hypothetical protein [Nocardioides carbamazepini]MCR1783213.1 hypothetical protein [Nocardioides carbamazepini]
MSDPSARTLFRIAALFNFSAVLLFLPVLDLADRFGLDGAPTGTMFEHVGLAAIGLFGIGYWMAAGDPYRHRGIIQLGLAGKILVVALVLMHFNDGSVNGRLTTMVLGDAVFSVLFTWYLISSRAANPASSTSLSSSH